MNQFLYSRFLNAAERFGNRPGLEVAGEILSYATLRTAALQIAATIQRYAQPSRMPATAVFAYRTPIAYQGVLGSLLAGNAYVPLNRRFPPERTRTMLRRSGANTLIVDELSAVQLEEVLAGVEMPITIILPKSDQWGDLRDRWPQHQVVTMDNLAPESAWEPPALANDSLAYILFTSGSTGIPKGVMVMQRNVSAYVDFISERYGITEHDRFSQMFDLTFDLSASDMFVAWDRGACVCCPSEHALIAPGAYIRDRKITVWFSVPSVAMFMKRFSMLKSNLYPSVRVSLFCGEALPIEIAQAWRQAAPGSVVENLYGPTELTIACTFYKWDDVKSPMESILGIVPIGEPFPGMTAIVVDENLNEVNTGEDGELLMTGPQLTKGYLNDSERTSKAFMVPPGRNEVFYRTGDKVRRSANGTLLFIGRVDNQVKILGHRVELGEIEATARRLSGIDGVVAVPYPVTPSGAGALELFLETEEFDAEQLKTDLARELPVYMVPRNIHGVRQFPLNANGKVDRIALAKLLEISTNGQSTCQ